MAFALNRTGRMLDDGVQCTVDSCDEVGDRVVNDAADCGCAVDGDCEWTEYCSVAVHGGLCVCPWSVDLRGAGRRGRVIVS